MSDGKMSIDDINVYLEYVCKACLLLHSQLEHDFGSEVTTASDMKFRLTFERIDNFFRRACTLTSSTPLDVVQSIHLFPLLVCNRGYRPSYKNVYVISYSKTAPDKYSFFGLLLYQ